MCQGAHIVSNRPKLTGILIVMIPRCFIECPGLQEGKIRAAKICGLATNTKSTACLFVSVLLPLISRTGI